MYRNVDYASARARSKINHGRSKKACKIFLSSKNNFKPRKSQKGASPVSTGDTGQEVSQKNNWGCESEPVTVRAKKKEPGVPPIEKCFPETTIRDTAKYVEAIVGLGKGSRTRELKKKA